MATDYLTGDMATRSRRMTQAFESYNQLRVLRRPLTGLYLSFFVMVTLMILVGSVWMGLYVAKRITKPAERLATAAREIGKGRLDQRIEPQSNDEFGALTEAFNLMASELSSTRRRVERATVDLERRHHDVEGRRRYVETILERIATDIRSAYTLAYAPTRTGADGEARRTVRVRARSPDGRALTVRTRDGYFARRVEGQGPRP